jgi:glyoxylase-like metal-dependent hydrolase (beta-lactamase superfamily II)
MARAFASQADTEDKKITFSRLSDHAYAFTAEGDPNTGVIIGDDSVMVLDTQATPAMAQQVIERIRTVSDKPIRYVVLSHYHAVRVLGASAYGAEHIIASEATRELIVERGMQDWKSEFQRFPRLFRDAESIPGLTWPTITFSDRMTIWLGKVQVDIIHAGKGHTKGDTIAWLPGERVLFSGDLVEFGATPYAGDAYFQEWPQTLQRLRDMQATALVPGRGSALMTPQAVEEGLAGTQAFITELYAEVRRRAMAGGDLKAAYDAAMAKLAPRYGNWVIFEHCMPFDVSRAFDEAKGIEHPRIWTAERDIEMWKSLEQGSEAAGPKA